jgi:hypothetical protein
MKTQSSNSKLGSGTVVSEIPTDSLLSVTSVKKCFRTELHVVYSCLLQTSASFISCLLTIYRLFIYVVQFFCAPVMILTIVVVWCAYSRGPDFNS